MYALSSHYSLRLHDSWLQLESMTLVTMQAQPYNAGSAADPIVEANRHGQLHGYAPASERSLHGKHVKTAGYARVVFGKVL